MHDIRVTTQRMMMAFLLLTAAAGCRVKGAADPASTTVAATSAAAPVNAADLPEIVLLDSDKMKDQKGHPGGIIAEKTFWPFFAFPEPVPGNWKGSYENATVYGRLEVRKKPNANKTSLQYLIWQDATPGDGNNDKKIEIGGPKFVFKEPGVYTIDGTQGPIATGWGKINGTFDYTRMRDALGGIATKAHEKPHARPEGGPCNLHRVFKECWPFRDQYHPIEYRMILVAVPAGKTFSGWDKYTAN